MLLAVSILDGLIVDLSRYREHYLCRTQFIESVGPRDESLVGPVGCHVSLLRWVEESNFTREGMSQLADCNMQVSGKYYRPRILLDRINDLEAVLIISLEENTCVCQL